MKGKTNLLLVRKGMHQIRELDRRACGHDGLNASHRDDIVGFGHGFRTCAWGCVDIDQPCAVCDEGVGLRFGRDHHGQDHGLW